MKAKTQATSSSSRDHLQFRIVLAIIIILALALRLWHITWGLPEIYEEAYPFMIAWKMWNFGQASIDLNPHFFNYPALTFYLNFFLQAVHYALGHLIGWYSSLDAFRQAYESDPTKFIVLSRGLSVIFDVGTVVIVAYFLRRFSSPAIALLGAALMVINPLHIKQSQLIAVDTATTFFIILALYFIDRLRHNFAPRQVMVVAISIGLASSAKYTGAFLFPIFVLGVVLQQSASLKIRIQYAMFGSAVAVAVFFICNPYIILDSASFMKDVGFEESHMAAGHLGLDPTINTPTFYLTSALPNALGWGILYLGLASAAYVLVKWKKELFPLVAFLLLYGLIIFGWEMRADRYALPLIPVLCILACWGIGDIASRQRAFLSSPPSRQLVFISICLLLLGIQPTLGSIRYHRSIALSDTRAAAKEWLVNHLPPRSVVATIPFGLDLPESVFSVLPIPFRPVNAELAAPFFDTRWYEDCDIVIGTSFDRDRYALDPARYQNFLQYYTKLETEWEKVWSVESEKDQTGPKIWFYRPRSSASAFSTELFQNLAGEPDSSRISTFLRNLTTLLVQKKKYEKATQVFEEILSVEPANIAARQSLATIFALQGNTNEAIEVLRRYPQATRPLELDWLEGQLLMKASRLEEAEILFQRILKTNSNSGSVYENLLQIYVVQGEREKAIVILSRYLQILPPQSEKAKLVQQDLATLRSAQ